MRKIFIAISISILCMGYVSSAQAQTNRQYFLSIAPAYEIIYSQIEMRSQSVHAGFGIFNHYKFYIGGDMKYSYGKSIPEPYLRTVIFNRFSPGLKMKFLLLGNNRYKSDKYFDNLRFCFDLSSHYNFSYNQLYREGQLADRSLTNYLSADIGFSLLIPYGYVIKNTKLLFNRSDLYLEVLGSALINTDIANINAVSSDIHQVTTAAQIVFNWMYYF
ncbi:MAG: hypothetical protein ISR55_08400 [Bacteroidetes bacterium]|nr:hypothetical protein [Bacteroidota bacterium]